MSHGMILGKFMPPHAGHLHLVRFAAGFCDRLSVVVGSLAREPIEGALRAAWMRELCPTARVLHLTDENPQEPGEDPNFWEIWRQSLRRLLPEPIDYVFASESYGERLAHELGARFIPVDLERAALPISATRVRNDPLACWDYLPAPVRAHYARRVSVFGPESTGKTTLARALAEHYRTRWVPEYARTWLSAKARPEVEPADMPIIARGHIAAEEALARECNRLLFTDTDPLATCLWSEALFGVTDPRVTTLAAARHYPLTLLLEPDVPWVADPIRYLPGQGREFFERARASLEHAKRHFVVIGGGFEDRLRQAIRTIDAWAASPVP